MKWRANTLPRITAGMWTATVATIGAGAVGWTPDPRPNLAILAVGASLATTTIGHANRILVAILRVHRRELTAARRLERTAITPVREAFLHGVEYGQAAPRAAGGGIVVPRQIYTAPSLQAERVVARAAMSCGVDTTATVELPRIRDCDTVVYGRHAADAPTPAATVTPLRRPRPRSGHRPDPRP